MKRISIFFAVLLLWSGLDARAQDPATEERLNRLNGLVQDLQEDKAIQKRQIESLTREIQALREQLARPVGNFASQEELRKLAEKLQEVDRKREADKELILKEFEKLVKLVASPPGRRQPATPTTPPTAPGGEGKVFEYTVAQGDTLSAIMQAYRDKGVKVTLKQILDANPGLVPERMPVGQKIFIPAP
ncbi:MAG: LysM peptidoglycan-binding domain-containing protein [Verrucomicrobia bacterium]|nr:LysM peptidoglycan-binding domain-containing protein [Verrucomicrobiota bacterium]